MAIENEKLNKITDKVFQHADGPKGPLNVIAGAPDRPLVIGDTEIPCYVLEDETRVLAQRGMASSLGMAPSGGQRFKAFMSLKTIKPFVSNQLMLDIENPVVFKNPVGGGVAYGHPATLLVDACNTVLLARDAGALSKQQEHIAHRCDILIRALANVGIIALVDEATGYERRRAKRALATILERFIAKELQPWTRTFPVEFYENICRLKKWPAPYATIKRPSLIGRYTNDFVYDRLAPGVRDELRRVNPVVPETGRRRHKHHQWFTPKLGHPKLQQHLAGVMALLRIATSWDDFKRKMDIAFPRQNMTIPMNLDEGTPS